MAIETERKFLVHPERWAQLTKPAGQQIRQGYLTHTPSHSVRIRLAGEAAFLTVKGETNGISRAEFEYPIPPADAAEMLRMFCRQLIFKTRYRIPCNGHVWEVDVFAGENEGLIIAEVELQSETEPVSLPPWVADEVTGDPRYYNTQLSLAPFTTWQR